MEERKEVESVIWAGQLSFMDVWMKKSKKEFYKIFLPVMKVLKVVKQSIWR